MTLPRGARRISQLRHDLARSHRVEESIALFARFVAEEFQVEIVHVVDIRNGSYSYEASLDQQSIQHSATRIHGRAQTGWAASDDNHVVLRFLSFCLAHVTLTYTFDLVAQTQLARAQFPSLDACAVQGLDLH